MLSYWILRDRSGAPIGLVRGEDGHMIFRLNAPVSADWTLCSDAGSVPIEPNAEAYLADAKALIGLRDGTVVGFAAAKGAPSAACYRDRLSRLCTIYVDAPSSEDPPDPSESQPSPEEPKTSDEEEVFSASEPIESVHDSAGRTAQFSLLLERADAFYAQFDAPVAAPPENMVQKEDMSVEDAGGIDLFPQAFPRARWRYVDGADVLPHYEGLLIGPNGERTRILAVRGRSAPRPPRVLSGFSRFLRGADGCGYWIRTE